MYYFPKKLKKKLNLANSEDKKTKYWIINDMKYLPALFSLIKEDKPILYQNESCSICY